MAKRAKAKVNLPIIIAAILLCLTLFSIHLTSGVYARYTATASGSDSARVIKFGDIALTDNGTNELIVIPGVPIERTVTLSFSGSESATYIFAEVNLTDGQEGWAFDDQTYTFTALYFDHDNDNGTAEVPGISLAVADGWTYVAGSSNPYAFSRALAANDLLSATPVIKDSTISVHPDLTATDLKAIFGEKTLAVNFGASVVQSNGFNSVADAWSSLEANH